MPDSDSEIPDRVGVAYTRGETRDSALAFDPTPCDGRLRQRVEGVTLERRAPGRKDDDDRLVRRERHGPTLAARE
ncbi:MAG TPA: hypothetical protein VKQ05_12425 [Gemmatimonadales bacterium]|nr:hypothetical protein [Gemmatimonadales bacterium]